MLQKKELYLEAVDIFRDLTPAEVEVIGHRTTLMNYRAGHLFYAPDDQGEALFILKHGRVQIYRISPDGRKFIVSILHPGAIFGHMALVGQRMHNAFAEALDDCLICIWDRAEIEHVMADKPQIALRFLESVSARLLQAEQRLEEMTFKRVPARIAGLIIQLDQEHGSKGVVRGYTHQSFADMIGTYRETVTHTLNDFKDQDLIRIGRKTIEILDVKGLRSVADS
ncbi:MAG: Crp/Fnr family transcriptional regulator [Anaerolineae bacterium]|nr:Crp/Fnr family transcriptional regulator [Anaerolineae bacterium]